MISGTYRIPEKEAQRIGRPAHRGLVVTVTGRFHRRTIEPFRRAFLFPEDEIPVEGAREGAFNADVGRGSPFRDPGVYYVTVSLGTSLSNTLEIEVA